MAKGKRTNPVVLRRGMAVGTGNAETDDEFLFDCFVHYPPVEECLRIQSPGMILSGRTGSGKTAIIRHIQRAEPNVTEIDPAEMSMNYVANSDALRFLDAIGADLDLLFQVLWKHVLCIEYIRLRWRVESEEKSRNVFNRIFDPLFSDARKARAISYLKQWEGKFWITTDQNIKEITEIFENKLQAEFGADIEKFKAGGQYQKRLSTERKSELIYRARNIINADQLRELHGVIDILKGESDGNEKSKEYILIDKLDEYWVDEALRFKMIKGLISTLKSFRAIKTLKLLVAIRSDIIERVVQETEDITFQREKYEAYFIDLRWTKSELKELVEKRIKALFRRQYTGRDVAFGDVFAYNIGNRDPFEYILDRTHMRPREVIAFVNECISAADGTYEVAPKHVNRAEAAYSTKRRDALEQEWRSAFPSLGAALNFVTAHRKVSSTWKELHDSDELDNLALGICVKGKADFDPLFEPCQAFLDEKPNSRQMVLKVVLAVLYRVGAIGLKLRPDERFLYSHIDTPLIAPEMLGEGIRVRIHPMLHEAYRLHNRPDRETHRGTL